MSLISVILCGIRNYGNSNKSRIFQNLKRRKKKKFTLKMLQAPVGDSGFRSPRSFRYAQTFGLNIPTAKLRHIFAALVFATQSPYPGCQTVVNVRLTNPYLLSVMPYLLYLIRKSGLIPRGLPRLKGRNAYKNLVVNQTV
jgi:hypothetical protein